MTVVDVVIPTHDHALLLPYSIRSVLAQTVTDLRVHVIGDGVADDTRDAVAELMRDDDRIRFHDLPKAGRTGEPHRHPIVSASDADIVTYLGDDDVMLRDHAATMVATLATCDVAFPPPMIRGPGGRTTCLLHTLELPYWRAQARAGRSLFSLSGMSHTADAYRRLPYGWRTAPEGFYTDQYMIMQFLDQEWCRFGLGDWPTVVRFPAPARRDQSPEQRRDELDSFWTGLQASGGHDAVRREAFAATRRRGNRFEIDLARLQAEHDRLIAERASTAEPSDD